MGNAITVKIEASKANSALTRKEKTANREAVKELAAKHMEAAIKKLSEIVADKNSPASAKVAAATQLLDRVAGKPKLIDEKQSEQSQLERMSSPELLTFICSTLVCLSLEARATIAEALLYAQRGIPLPDRFVDPDYDEDAASKAEAEAAKPEGLPPLERKPRKEPRR